MSLVGETELSVLFLSFDGGREAVRPELELEGGVRGRGKTFPFTIDDKDDEEDATFSLEDLGQPCCRARAKKAETRWKTRLTFPQPSLITGDWPRKCVYLE